MLKGLISKVVGDPNAREIQKLGPIVDAINALEPEMERRTQTELRALSDEFLARLASGSTLDDLLPEAFAAVREVAKRTVDMRPFDVQLIGGIVLHQGRVAEMRTGEGKTLVGTMPVYLNALTRRGVHLVTVNDYLARRDALWMGPIYHLMGLSVGLLQSGTEQPAYLLDPDYQREPYPGLRPVPRAEAYAADITYGTNNEFGFDYLRDNLALSLERRVQRPLYYAIVDEVDNIFIDEARTPLIISGPSGEPVEEYNLFATIARKLEPEVHYEMDEKERSVFLSDAGLALVEQEIGIENIYDEANYRYVHYMQQALKAQVLFLEGRDYIRQRREIVLIDQHTGRLTPNRRLSEGLHQAIEAKEGVPVRPRDVTSATITIQNYFRMYEKLAGMSGTAVTEGEEFFKIYNLDVLSIPTNKPVIRQDHRDVVYRSEEAKLRAVAREILTCHCHGQPVLVGTTSVDMSEHLSRRLTGERLQMAAMSPRIAHALQDMDLEREQRSALRETMNDNLETLNLAAWRRMVRDLDLNPNALAPENLDWLANYLELEDPAAQKALEKALRDGIDHEVLNAKEHTREAAIIARAGEPGAITIATNMAGRGVDIKLGGDLSDEVIHKAHMALRARGLDPFRAISTQMDSAVAEVAPQYAKNRDRVLNAGGLHVLGTERHEARRIDNQLRGRSGRQGEPGSSRFYLSLEDDLMRRFGRREMLSKLMESIGDDFPIEHGLVGKTLERAQTSVEGYNFDIRKHLLEYDDVLNRQRESIYGERLRILQTDDLQDDVWRMFEGQVDEYLVKWGEDSEQVRLIFAGLDDVVPLMLPAPSNPFQGPLAFGGSLTAFPPFTISFLADQFSGQPLDSVQKALASLAQHAAEGYGEQIRQSVSEAAHATLEKYDERMERYQTLLAEKIDDYLQLAEERGIPLELRKLAQHLERTYPLKLSLPRSTEDMTLSDIQDVWSNDVEIEFHRQICAGLIDRVQVRLPGDIQLDHLRPARLLDSKLADETRRVLDLAARLPKSEAAKNRLVLVEPPKSSDPAQVLDFITTIKAQSDLDQSRLDRLVNHVLGAYLDDLLSRYRQSLESQSGVQRDLERLQDSVVEGKKGARTGDLLALLQQLNDTVHLEIPEMESLLSITVSHEYDKWAQRQLSEIRIETKRNPLPDTSWTSIAEHLIAVHYTQKQTYDRGHRRQTTWMPRLPFSSLAQTHAEAMDVDTLRAALLTSLKWAIEQRELSWGRQELKRWGHLSAGDLNAEARDSLLRYLGAQVLGDEADETVEDLSRPIHDRLQFILGLRQVKDRRLADLPQADALLKRLGDAYESQILDTPLSELDRDIRERVGTQLRRSGVLDNAQTRTKLLQTQIQNWDQQTQDAVAELLGKQFIDTHKNEPIEALPPEARQTAIAYLQGQRRFVDETRVQRFLVHQQLSDVPTEIAEAALDYLARTRLERVERRKISNLDVATRDIVTSFLQRTGMFTDKNRQEELLAHPLDTLEPDILDAFGHFLAREQAQERGLAGMDAHIRDYVITRLKQMDLLATVDQREALPGKRLNQLDATTAAQVREQLTEQLDQDLHQKSMEELPAMMRQHIHRILEDRDYFVDRDKVSWYERNTLAQLAPDLLAALEKQLGQVRLAEIGETPFSDLTSDVQSDMLDTFDREGLLIERADRLRLTQTGSLNDLSDKDRETLVRSIGRRWLAQLRPQRPTSLSDEDREQVWIALRAQGYFSDEFKEELFEFQRLDEFDVETREAIRESLKDQINETLNATTLVDLPQELKSSVLDNIRNTDLLVDPERLRLVDELPYSSLPADLGEAVQQALASCLLERMGPGPIAALPAEQQHDLWRYLDEIGYFVDDAKQNQVLERRIIDLSVEQQDSLVLELRARLEEATADRPVSDLGDELRQGLREAVESTGFFETEEERAKNLARTIGSFRREDLEALAVAFGQNQLAAMSGRCLADLPSGEQEPILAHLQQKDRFLDQERFQQMQGSSLKAVGADVQQELVSTLRNQQVTRLRDLRLANLPSEQRQIALAFLRDAGLTCDDSQMRSLRRQKLKALDEQVYHELLKDLGRDTVAEWGSRRFQELNEEQQERLSAYMGRRIMAHIERRVLLNTISRLWIDYLTDIEDLRRGIGLEAYGQRDPLVEYKRRAFELFEELGNNIRRTVVRSLFRRPPEPNEMQQSA